MSHRLSEWKGWNPIESKELEVPSWVLNFIQEDICIAEELQECYR